jgi:hypothetical protein
MRLHRTLMLAGLLAVPVVSSISLAHAQSKATGLPTRDRAAFLALWPPVQRCDSRLQTVTRDLTIAAANVRAGRDYPGRLGPDARRMWLDCQDAAERARRVHFPARASHAAARRTQAELHTALTDLAQGAFITINVAVDIEVDDFGAASRESAAAGRLWSKGAAHMSAVARALRLR